MSLINKMLQDLDARGGQNASAVPEQVKPVPLPERGVPARAIGIGVAVLALVGAGAYGGWRYIHRTPAVSVPATPGAVFAHAPAAAPAPPRAAPPVAGAPAAEAAATAADVPAPAGVPAPVSVPAAAATAHAPVSAARAPGAIAPSVGIAVAAPAAVAAPPAPAAASAAAALADVPAAQPAARKKTVAEKARDNASGVSAAAAAKRAKASATGKPKRGTKAKAAAKPDSSPKPPAQSSAKPQSRSAAAAAASTGKQMTAQQQSESLYRRATSALEEGRVSEAMNQLNDALKVNPRHDAARQTLVGLLVEAHRPEEAMRLLQTGLTLEPRQPAMAMLLARLQMERGADGIETLQRTLPYASGNAEYHGFLAGALQHAGRHREAIDQYQAALRGAPLNGVWWMGLGISLQAEKRVPEATDAFRRAKSSGTLSAELQAFIDRKLQQLAR